MLALGANNLKDMPWQNEVGIAVGSVAGAAAVAGGIAGIVEAQKNAPKPPAMKKKDSDASDPLVAVIPIEVQVTAAPAPAATPAPAPFTPKLAGASFRLYNNDKQKAATPVAQTVMNDGVFNDRMLMGVAGFLLFLGLVFLGMGSVVYCKTNRRKRAAESNDTEYEAGSIYEEVSEGEDGEESLA